MNVLATLEMLPATRPEATRMPCTDSRTCEDFSNCHCTMEDLVTWTTITTYRSIEE